MKIPIFIISHDRLTCLKESIKSYNDQIKTDFEIIIFDVNSKYQPTIDYLKDLESKGTKIYWHKEDKDDFFNVRIGIKDYYAKNKNASPYYVVTDPDIQLDNVNGDILDFYIFLLNRFKVHCVGPMLRIDDIPDTYPLKEKAVKSHTRQFWHKNPSTVQYKTNTFKYQKAPIASTFALYTNKFPFGRVSPGIRTYAPYAARHLDWYLDLENLTPDQEFYLRNATHNGHWAASYLRNVKK